MPPPAPTVDTDPLRLIELALAAAAAPAPEEEELLAVVAALPSLLSLLTNLSPSLLRSRSRSFI